jgi:hypothetical protein
MISVIERLAAGWGPLRYAADIPLHLWERIRLGLAPPALREQHLYFAPEWEDGRDPRLIGELERINADLPGWLDPGSVSAPPAGSVREEAGFLRFPSPRPLGIEGVDEVALRVYPAPPDAPSVGVLFHHWMYLSDLSHVEMLLRPLLGRCRLAVMIASHHLQRRAAGWGHGEGMINPNPLHLFRAFRQWQSDHAASLRLLARDHGFERTVILGYSMGGYNALLARLCGPRISTVGVCVTNNYYEGVMKGSATAELRQRLREAGYTPEAFRQAVHSLHLARYARGIEGEKLTWIRARMDAFEPRASLHEARRALAPAREIVLPGGHSSAILFRERIAAEVLDRVREESQVLAS